MKESNKDYMKTRDIDDLTYYIRSPFCFVSGQESNDADDALDELLHRLSEGQRAIELISAIREERGFHKHNFLDVLDAMIGKWEGK